jgi:hypothetical protein
VDNGSDNRAEDQHREDERQHEPPPRIGKNEESDVETEPWVSDVEWGCVLPGQVVQHPAASRTASKQADDGTYGYEHPYELGFQHFAIALK